MDRQYWDEALQGGFSSAVSGINPMVSGASASFDPIHMVSNWNLSRRKEAAARLAADSMAARSGPVGQGWSGGLGSGPDVQSRSGCVLNEESGGVAPEFCNFREIKAPPAGSLESLDCLLSATNSNTGASVEDDGISMLFSPNCKRLWSFSAGNAVSSGESTVAVSDADPSDFNIISENVKLKSKKSRTESRRRINFQLPSSSASSVEEPDTEAIVQMKEMIYRAAAFRPVNFGAEVLEKPKRKNVRISTDPQTVAARQRRERISERIRALQRLVPGGSKMDTASMLDEAANYLKFLRSQVKALEGFGQTIDSSSSSLNFNPLISASLPLNSFSVPMQPNFPTHSPNPIHRPSSSNSSQAKF